MRITTNNPQGNVSAALNLFYAKDGWAWVRGGGPAPDYTDISLNDYVRMIAREHKLEIAKSNSEDEISSEMAELLLDGTNTIDGIVATLYTAGWAFAELRERLSAYEDTGLSPEEITNLKKQEENKPLTLDELRGMAWSQSPVWCRDFDGLHTGLLCIKDDLVVPERTAHIWLLDEEGNSGVYSVNSLLKCGAEFYRHKPEEGAK